MLIVNLFGGPGAGKSTLAADLFVRLRQETKLNVELTNEFATDLCFERAKDNLKDQLYLLGNQWHRIWRLAEIGVDIAISDSPIGLGSAHALKHGCFYKDELKALTTRLFEEYDTFNVFVYRDIYAEGGFKGNKKQSVKGLAYVYDLDQKIYDMNQPFDVKVNFADKAHTDYIMTMLKVRLEVGPPVPMPAPELVGRKNLEGYWVKHES